MVIDTSAIVAILRKEREHLDFTYLITSANLRLISAATVLETATVLEARFGESVGREFDEFLLDAQIVIINVDRGQVEVARTAWRKYGKGRHRAALNFGDCFVYALAKVKGEPGLAKGNDFRLTDIEMCATGR
jgi:ribonuclease VapC